MLADDSMTPCPHFQSCVSYIFLTKELVNRKICPDCLLFQEKKQKFIDSFEVVLFYEKCYPLFIRYLRVIMTVTWLCAIAC